jgi:hypothetical protein
MENYSEDKIFYSDDFTTTSSTTTKKKTQPMFYDKVIIQKKRKAISILIDGLTGKEMEPSDLRRYDSYILDIKAASIAIFIGVAMFFIVAKSFVGSEPASRKHDRTYIDMLIDWIAGKDNSDEKIYNVPPPAPKEVVIIKDSLVNIDSIAYIIQQSDSILKAVRAVDTNHLN